MKFFPLTVHVILAFVAIGVAAGLKADGATHVVQYGFNGLAVGLSVTAFFRVLTS